MSLFYSKKRLFCPGPTPVPDPSWEAARRDYDYHRSPSFEDHFLACTRMLQPLFGSSQAPIILSSSGTGAMEAALCHVTSRGDEVVVVNAGKFGQRWQEMANAYDLKVSPCALPWGRSAHSQDVLQALAPLRSPRAVFLQAVETSTGAYHDIATIARDVKARYPDIFLVVDGISSVGIHPLKMQEWAIDCVVSGSQKGFGVPPGLSFLAFSDRALAYTTNHARYYFYLPKEHQLQQQGRCAWTPAISAIMALKSSLSLMHQRGLPQIYAQHQHAATALQRALKAMGFSLFAQNQRAHCLTAFSLPSSLNGQQLLTHLREYYGAVFAGGQEHLKGKILRIAHMGFFDRLDLISSLATLEMALRDLGHSPTTSGLPTLTAALAESALKDQESAALSQR